MTQFRIPANAVPAPAATAGTPAPAHIAIPASTALTAVADAVAEPAEGPGYLLHFEPLGAQGAGLDVPCDRQGRVGLDALGERLRNDYLFARALIGCLFSRPTVRRARAAHA